MTQEEMLRLKISPYKLKYVASVLDVSSSSLTFKLNDTGSFTFSEVCKLQNLLNLTYQELIDIFYKPPKPRVNSNRRPTTQAERRKKRNDNGRNDFNESSKGAGTV